MAWHGSSHNTDRAMGHVVSHLFAVSTRHLIVLAAPTVTEDDPAFTIGSFVFILVAVTGRIIIVVVVVTVVLEDIEVRVARV